MLFRLVILVLFTIFYRVETRTKEGFIKTYCHTLILFNNRSGSIHSYL